MSIALQQEVVALREQLAEVRTQLADTRTQLSKLSAQFVVGESKRADLTARIAQLEDALRGIQSDKQQPKEIVHGNRQPRAKARA